MTTPAPAQKKRPDFRRYDKPDDYRMLILLGLVVLFGMVGGFALSHQNDKTNQVIAKFKVEDALFQKQSVANCLVTRQGIIQQNAILDQLIVVTAADKDIAPPEKVAWIKAYRGLKVPVADCPPLPTTVSK